MARTFQLVGPLVVGLVVTLGGSGSVGAQQGTPAGHDTHPAPAAATPASPRQAPAAASAPEKHSHTIPSTKSGSRKAADSAIGSALERIQHRIETELAPTSAKPVVARRAAGAVSRVAAAAPQPAKPSAALPVTLVWKTELVWPSLATTTTSPEPPAPVVLFWR